MRKAMLGEEIGGIFLSKHLLEFYPLAADGLLDTHGVSINLPSHWREQMPKAALESVRLLEIL